jgi:predicted MPP superfamily phosphohydrolase
MNTRNPQALIEKLKDLPPQRIAEVEDFVDFLRAREDEQRLTRAASKASEASFAAVWDNDEDAAYDRI